jgi:AcrR family transcriptional regulator
MPQKKSASKPYHHGNLREEFIRSGLEYIDRYGIEELSMRKLAESIGVSSAAPYAHFKNKDSFLDAIQEHITECLTQSLTQAADNCKDNKEILLDLGRSYVIFFYNNPLYFQFLFSRRSIDVNTFPPFVYYSQIASAALKQMHTKRLTSETIRRKTIAMWATVHGLAQFTLMDGILNTDRLEDELNGLMCALEV